MAKVLSESAQYTTQAAGQEHERILKLCLVVIAAICVIEGALVASLVPVRLLPIWLRVWVIPTAAFGGVLVIRQWSLSKLQFIEKLRANMRRGASGEVQVGLILKDLPETYYVINDIRTKDGNLDHVVVGPTGIFVLETKNWRGVVTPDGNDELCLNNKKTEKEFIRQFVRRMMDVREKVQLRAGDCDKQWRYQAVVVFTSAWVNAKWGETGAAHCIRETQLFDYIVDKKYAQRLQNEEVKRLAQAFFELARTL